MEKLPRRLLGIKNRQRTSKREASSAVWVSRHAHGWVWVVARDCCIKQSHSQWRQNAWCMPGGGLLALLVRIAQPNRPITVVRLVGKRERLIQRP